MIRAPADLEALRAGGKQALARALTALETTAGETGLPDPATLALLDTAWADPTGRVIGLTGPPGVGKSTLTDALLQRFRGEGLRVGVIAVDPSSLITGGALLGDRTRIRTDPEGEATFVRSFAARDRLGGLSDQAFAAAVLMRAVHDRVIVESVGIGQSEADIGLVADTLVLCVQPGSGDSLQFMKAGIMELPDVVAVTKADTGSAARRARADVEGAIGLFERRSQWSVPVVPVSAVTGEGLDDLVAAVDAHGAYMGEADRLAERRDRQALDWMRDGVRQRFGAYGSKRMNSLSLEPDASAPFRALAEIIARIMPGPDPKQSR